MKYRLVKGRFNRYEGGELVKYKHGDVVELSAEEARAHRDNFRIVVAATPPPTSMRHVVPAPPLKTEEKVEEKAAKKSDKSFDKE